MTPGKFLGHVNPREKKVCPRDIQDQGLCSFRTLFLLSSLLSFLEIQIFFFKSHCTIPFSSDGKLSLIILHVMILGDS